MVLSKDVEGLEKTVQYGSDFDWEEIKKEPVFKLELIPLQYNRTAAPYNSFIAGSTSQRSDVAEEAIWF